MPEIINQMPKNEVSAAESSAEKEAERILIEQKLNDELQKEGVADNYQALVIPKEKIAPTAKEKQPTIVKIFNSQGELVSQYEYKPGKISIKG